MKLPAFAYVVLLSVCFAGSAFANSTHCTVISSAPTTLSKAGLYCLTDDLSHSTGGAAIEIDADNVTVDLNGHTIRATRSPGEAEVSYAGVTVSGHKYFSIIDGVISGFTFGVFVSDTFKGHAEGGLVADLKVIKASDGIAVSYAGCIVRNNIVTETTTVSGQNGATIYGVVVDGTGNQVTGNRIYATANGSANTHPGAALELEGTFSTASGNYVANEVPSPNTIVYGIHVTGSNMLLTDNQVENFTYCYWLEGASLKYRNNLSNGCGESFGGAGVNQVDLGGNN